jgi:hypothetical protein
VFPLRRIWWNVFAPGGLVRRASVRQYNKGTMAGGHEKESLRHTEKPSAGACLAVVATLCTVQPCNFVYSIKTCESTDPTVSMSGYYYGDTSACTFVWNIYRGDGASSTDIVQTDPTDGCHFLASHTYAAPGTYTITDSTQVTAGTCTASNGDHTFTLLASPPPAPSPKIHWSRTSSLPGRLVTLTGSGWVPGGIVQFLPGASTPRATGRSLLP